MVFNQRIEANVKRSPDKVILSDEYGNYTNAQMWECSSKTYSYLVDRGIGKESIVLIHLPRGAQAIMAMIGVFRVGATVVMLEDWGENEWVDFVKKETNPKLIIETTLFNTIQNYQPKDGYAIPDKHDLAYISYTTGTTGKSKGVMQEYGIIEQYFTSDEDVPPTIDVEECSLALTPTLHTSIVSAVYYIAHNTYIDIVPYSVFNSWPLFLNRLEKNRIGTTYMSPLYLHKYGIPYTPYLKYLSVSFEPTYNLYSNSVPLVNEYAARETGSTISLFVIDKPYDITPIGKPLPGFNINILDKNNKPVKDGEIGELCIENKYCRGYLNLQADTAAQFRDGLYHTNDLGKRLPDGNYIVYGRTNDAIKTEKGVIIALEIESIARKILKKTTVYIKVFNTENKPTICLYADFEINLSDLQSKMRDYLPEHKIPTDYVLVDNFEYKNGKAIRVNLKNPRA